VAICCTCLTLKPHFASSRFRQWRAGFYASLGLSFNIVFIVHGLLIHEWEVQKAHMSLEYIGWTAIFNLVGAVIYAARVSLSYSRFSELRLTLSRFLRDMLPISLIFGVQVTRYSMLPLWSPLGSISAAWSRRSLRFVLCQTCAVKRKRA
jgi:hypothetical protein